jgi:2-polyprenyl-6-methoxyphenol hydroxylase-like FAD-dependent oxidoreductase
MTTERSHFLAGKKIIVAGSGIAGLAFAAALRKQWDDRLQPPHLVLYDRDPREVSQRREGYSLSLNGASKDEGLVAMRDLGLLDEVLQHAVLGPDSAKTFRLWDRDFGTMMSVQIEPYGGLPTAGIRIARRDLRNLLIAAGEGAANRVDWGTRCLGARQLDNGQISVDLSQGKDGATRTEICDLLVAADGAHSKIRAAFRPDDGLIYRGVTQMGGIAYFPDGVFPPPLDSSWGMAVSGEGVGCFMSPVSPTTAVWSLSRPEPTERPAFDGSSASLDEAQRVFHEARSIGLEVFGGPFGAVTSQTDPSTVFRLPARDKDPFMHDTVPPGIVFLGDANHAVSPFAGNGANLALKDGWDLATQLCAHQSLRQAVAAYDKLAVGRARDTLSTSYQRMGVAHAKGFFFQLLRVGFFLGRWAMFAKMKLSAWLSGSNRR